MLPFFFSQPVCFTVPLRNNTLFNLINKVSCETTPGTLLKLKLVRHTVFSVLENHSSAVKRGSLVYQSNLQPAKMCLVASSLPVWV